MKVKALNGAVYEYTCSSTNTKILGDGEYYEMETNCFSTKL